ncbi:nucleotide exchange factor GrpE [Candidatus Sumerlaeota bacterium]|nr:nucleotide exchange factor GrpE [Candidatus Sumerlaeota bacterium]
MKSIINILFSRYFELTPERLEIYEPIREKSRDSQNGLALNDDLITLISRVMLENERLQTIREELERRYETSEEMESFMKKVVVFLDGFERILNLAREYPPSKEVNNWLKSVETLYYRFFHFLEKLGLKPLDTIGKEVNLNYHDVVEYRPTLNYKPDTIISERQKGYYFKDKLIRDAKVVVAYNPTSG